MKKVLSLTLCAAMLLCAAGCSGKQNSAAKSTAQKTDIITTQQPEAEPEDTTLDITGRWVWQADANDLLKMQGYSLEELLLNDFEVTIDPSVLQFNKSASYTFTFDDENAVILLKGKEIDAVMLDMYRTICGYLGNYTNAEEAYYQDQAALDQRALTRFGTETWQEGLEKLYNEYASGVADVPSQDISDTTPYTVEDNRVTIGEDIFEYTDNTLTGEYNGINVVLTKEEGE